MERVRLGRAFAAVMMLTASGAVPTWAQTAPKVSGFIQTIGTLDESALTTLAAGQDQTKSSFGLKRVRVSVTGDANEKAKYNLMLAGESGTVQLFNASLDYTLLDKALVGRVGQFKHPFALEGLESGNKRPMVILAEGTDSISKKLGNYGGSFRDMGAQLHGQMRLSYASLANVDYAFAVVNGSGPVINGAKDNNNFKDMIGRVQLNLPPYALVGASWHHGQSANQGQAFKQYERSYGVHAQLDLFEKKMMVRSEYLAGFYKNARGNLKDTNPLSWYVYAHYKVIPEVALQVRYEDWQANRLVTQGTLRTTTLGAAYQVSPTVSLKLNYLLRRAQVNAAAPADGTKATGGRIRNLTAVQLQYEF